MEKEKEEKNIAILMGEGVCTGHCGGRDQCN
jgi:hypothetical protein